MISPVSTNPTLTERGLTNVFRVVGRDDVQGVMAGNYLADHWGDRQIAILHDGSAYVKGLADETKKQLNGRGVAEGLYEQVEHGAVDYWDLIDRMQRAGIDVVYFPGRDPEVGLFIRQARSHGMEFQLVTGDNNVTETFRMIAGDAAEGTLLTSYPDVRGKPEAAELVAELRARQFPPDLPPSLPLMAVVHGDGQQPSTVASSCLDGAPPAAPRSSCRGAAAACRRNDPPGRAIPTVPR